MLRADLLVAGIPHRDDAGCVVDFHALRHAYVSRLVSSGASVKVAQELARHSTPTLTIGRYAHARLEDLSRALNNLPDADSQTGAENDQQARRHAAETMARVYPPASKPDNSGAAGSGMARWRATTVIELLPRTARVTLRRVRIQARMCDVLRSKTTKPPMGLEPMACGLQNRCHTSGAGSPATSCGNEIADMSSCMSFLRQSHPDLATVADAWATLPEPIKAGILAMIRAARLVGDGG